MDRAGSVLAVGGAVVVVLVDDVVGSVVLVVASVVLGATEVDAALEVVVVPSADAAGVGVVVAGEVVATVEVGAPAEESLHAESRTRPVSTAVDLAPRRPAMRGASYGPLFDRAGHGVVRRHPTTTAEER
jgi:hypothetical protein